MVSLLLTLAQPNRAILTILQIESAASNLLTRFSALLSLICAFMSLIYGCLYIIRFGTMRKTHKAAEWANVSQYAASPLSNLDADTLFSHSRNPRGLRHRSSGTSG